jgi:hypothetical protein
MEIRSPGSIEGAMLVPKTRIRILPNDRMTSSTKAFDILSLALMKAACVTGYEAFLLNLQFCSVERTLPHARAATSKTFSKRKEGAEYGFFAVVFGSWVCSPEELSLFKYSASRGTINCESIAEPSPANAHQFSADCVAFTRVFPVFVA